MLDIVSRNPAGKVTKPIDFVRGTSCRLPWVWDKLVFAVPMHENSFIGLRDVVSNVSGSVNTPSNFTPGFGWQKDTRGNAVSYFTSVDYCQYTDNPTHDSPSTEFTAYVRFQYITQGDPWGGYLANPHTDGGPLFSTWSIQDNGNGLYQPYSELSISGTEYFISSTSALDQSQYYSFFLRWRSGEAPSLSVYDDKGLLKQSTTYGSTISGSLTYNTGQGIRLNSMESTSGNGDNKYSQALVWGRKLSDTEIIAFLGDPFGWYSPHRETIVLAGAYPIGLIGTPQIGNASAINWSL